jgi:hypothetical protein
LSSGIKQIDRSEPMPAISMPTVSGYAMKEDSMKKADLPTLGQLPRNVPSSRFSTVYAQTTRKQRSLVIVTSLGFRSPVPVSMSVVSLKVFNQNPSDYLNRSQRDFGVLFNGF